MSNSDNIDGDSLIKLLYIILGVEVCMPFIIFTVLKLLGVI